MPLLQYFLSGFLDSLIAHLVLVFYLLAVTDEQSIWKQLKKLPILLVSPLTAAMIVTGFTYIIPEFSAFKFCVSTFFIYIMCTLWVMWTYRLDFWRAFSSVCMGGLLQMATSTIGQVTYLALPDGLEATISLYAFGLFFSAAVAVLLKKFRFGVGFRLLLEEQSSLHQTAALIFAMEISVQIFFNLRHGVQQSYLLSYYFLVAVLVIVQVVLIVYLGHRIDDRRTLQAQRDIIAQQQLYEQSLEDLRREVRCFRHDYKNLLVGLTLQAKEDKRGELCIALSELEADFDRNLGEKIQLSTQIGNLRIIQVRSLLLGKLSAWRENKVECRLEALYPVERVDMKVWDFVRCLGILLDNAAEAALETERPWVEIVLSAWNGQVFLRVSNPYRNAFDPEKMWQEGWSTKGVGRGLGLSSYQKILEKYSNATFSTVWEEGVFVQELIVEESV